MCFLCLFCFLFLFVCLFFVLHRWFEPNEQIRTLFYCVKVQVKLHSRFGVPATQVILICKLYRYNYCLAETYELQITWITSTKIKVSYFPNCSPSSIVSGRLWPLVSGKKSTSNPAITATLPNTISGRGCQ